MRVISGKLVAILTLIVLVLLVDSAWAESGRTLDWITIKRNDIDLLDKDKYGHYWIEILDGPNGKPVESYGWWPKSFVDLGETLVGVPGELNGQTHHGGTPTTDPDQGKPADTEFHPRLMNALTDQQVLDKIHEFVRSYKGEWRWTFGWGQNCRTFQTALMNYVGLIEPNSEDTSGTSLDISVSNQGTSSVGRSSFEAGMEEGFWFGLDQVPFVPVETIRLIKERVKNGESVLPAWYDPYWDQMGWAWMEDGAGGVADGVGAGVLKTVFEVVDTTNDVVSITNNYVDEFGYPGSPSGSSEGSQSISSPQIAGSSVSQNQETLNPPILSAPGSGTGPGDSIDTLTPTFEWSGDSNVDYYALYISKYPYGTANIIFDSSKNYGTLTGNSLSLPSGYLQQGMKYRWNMKAHSSSGWSSISNTLYFQTSASGQKLDDAALIGPQAPLFRTSEKTAIQQCWSGRQLSESELASTVKSNFPSGIISKTGENIQVIAYAVARAESSRDPTACGDCGKTTCSDNDNPSTSSIGLWQINLNWHPEYDRSWLFDPNNNAQAALQISSNGQDWQWWSTYKDGTYQHWIQEAQSALGLGTTIQDPTQQVPQPVASVSPPTLVSPGSGSEPGDSIDTLSPTLRWDSVPNADNYALYISKSPYGSANIIFDSTSNSGPISGTSFNLPTGYLQEGLKYRWNMKAHGSSGWSSISNTLYFKTSTSEPIVDLDPVAILSPQELSANPPILSAPGSGSEPGDLIDTFAPTFKWSGESNADYYALYISKYPYGAANIIFDSVKNYGILTGNTLSLPSGYLQEGMKYRWNMKAHSSSGWSSISNTLYFRTSTSDQNEVQFEAPSDTQVTLTLYVHEGSKNGPHIPGAMVTGRDGSGNGFSGSADGNGLVTLTGMPGTWSFVASASGYEDNSWDQDITSTCTKHAFLQKIYQEPVQTPVYQEQPQIPSTVTLTLYVHEGSKNGPHIPGAMVTGRDGSGNGFSGSADGNGLVTLTGIPGTWSFVASASGYEDNSWDQDITSSSTKHAFLQKIYQEPSMVTLTLYVHEGSKSGPYIPVVAVSGRDGSGNRFSGSANDNGAVTLTGIPGTWSFVASASGYEGNSWDQDITSSSTKHAFLQKVYQEPSTVTLALYVHEGSKNGPYIPGAKVTGRDGSGNRFSGSVDGSGLVTLTGIPGTWSFVASASGYEDNSWDQDITSSSTKHAFLQKVYQEPIQTLVYQESPQESSMVTLTLYVHEGSKNGPIIPGATVTGRDGSGNRFSGSADGNGIVTLTGTPGTWSFVASASGYMDNSWDQTISSTCTKHAFLNR